MYTKSNSRNRGFALVNKQNHGQACALMAILLLFSLSAVADETLDRARTLLGQKNPVAAYELLAPLAEAREGEPEFDYVFGIAALDAGFVTEAVFALERVLAMDPGNDVARAEIARAYFLLGETETAKQEFNTVRDSGSAPEATRSTNISPCLNGHPAPAMKPSSAAGSTLPAAMTVISIPELIRAKLRYRRSATCAFDSLTALPSKVMVSRSSPATSISRIH